jgi:flagellar hook-associated protein 3 FlgL
MRTTFVSTQWLYNSNRTRLASMQAEMSRLNQEITTGRKADVGLSLGVGTKEAITVRQASQQLSALIEGNGLVSARLDQTQAVLTNIADDANAFLQNLVAFSGSADSAGVLAGQAGSAMSAMFAAFNTNAASRFLFSGVNSESTPLAAFSGAPKSSIDNALIAKFGLTAPPQDDPALANVTGAQMQDFLDNDFGALFADPSWKTNWSSASDGGYTARISTTQDVRVDATTNDPAVRKMAMAYAMVSQLNVAGLGEDARQAVISTAQKVMGEAISGLTDMRGRIGLAQQDVKAATDAMNSRKMLLDQRSGALEEVDPAEAKTRLDLLSTQIEMSYSLTVKLSSLSLINYA